MTEEINIDGTIYLVIVEYIIYLIIVAILYFFHTKAIANTQTSQ